MNTSPSMRVLLGFATLMLLASCAHATLTSGERNALAQILAAFPALSSPRQDAMLYGTTGGPMRPWPTDFTNICSEDGYTIQGVHCTLGHVDGLLFSNAWGQIVPSAPLTALNGLTYLKHLNCPGHSKSMSNSFLEFVNTLFNAIAFESVSLGSGFFYDPAFTTILASQTSLLSLTAVGNADFTPDLLSLPQLQELELQTNWNFTDLNGFLPLANTLRKLTLTGYGHMSDIFYIGNLTALEEATIQLDGGSFTYDMFYPGPNLRSLTLSGSPSTEVYIANFFEDCPPLELIWTDTANGFSITEMPAQVVSLTLSAMFEADSSSLDFVFPPALQTLDLTGIYPASGFTIHPSLGDCHHLSSFGVFHKFVPALPSLLNTNITSLRIIAYEDANLTTLICELVDPSRLTSLSIDTTSDLTVPNCGSPTTPYTSLLAFSRSSATRGNITTFQEAVLPLLPSNLTYLSVRRLDAPAPDTTFNWTSLVTKLPHLEVLDMHGSYIGGTFPTEILQLSSLVELRLSDANLVGTIPLPLFSSLRKLKYLIAYSNTLVGTFPWSDLQTVEEIDVSYNSLQAWSSIYGVSANVKYVDMSYNSLTQIPDDISFSNMPLLQYLDFSHNQYLDGPVPRFWANHPSIDTVGCAGCNLAGTLPSSLLSPKLTDVDFSDNGNICGSLFNIPSPRGMFALNLEGNRLSGTYPSTWAQNLDIVSKLKLAANNLTGTLPSPPVTGVSGRPMTIRLESNNFHGPVPNFAACPGLNNIGLGYSSMDLCAALPHIMAPSATCILSSVAVDACNCAASWSNCTNLDCSGPSIAPANIIPDPAPAACITPPDRPAAGSPAPSTPVSDAHSSRLSSSMILQSFAGIVAMILVATTF